MIVWSPPTPTGASPSGAPTGLPFNDLPAWSPKVVPDSPGTTVLRPDQLGGCGGTAAPVILTAPAGGGNGAAGGACPCKTMASGDDTVAQVERWARMHQGWLILAALVIGVLALGRR